MVPRPECTASSQPGQCSIHFTCTATRNPASSLAMVLWCPQLVSPAEEDAGALRPPRLRGQSLYWGKSSLDSEAAWRERGHEK